ncbi:neurofilament medium polypeptide isoform X2 [Astyanax mexicanus]|uniref:neurofilament medium polypeptide isoform X2 n=1 Tax=Astyanax mexicanus TaxID=7994 RepID=UPI0020CB5E79|nr:neurofilament medium polypeptide isoform X2 [Astyanax mexicanus]
MDSGEQQEEDEVSARILLRRVLGSELIRSPVTRSVSQTQADSRRRRSSRVRNLPPAESPQSVLRHKLKHKLQQSSSQSPAPPTKRRRSQSRAVKTPVVSSSSLYDEDITPRGLLRGIIQTEAEASLLLSGQPAPPDTNQPLPETSSRLSEGASGLELPDLVTEPLSNLIGGMSRRRPPPTFNISAFERQLEQRSGQRAEPEEQNPDEPEEQDLSAASKSVLSLTLKTPFVNVQSERAGLRRKAANRRQPSVDAFDEAVQKRLNRNNNQEDTVVQEGRTLGDSDWQKFTLGLSNVTVPDLTTDIVMCNTELYPQPPAATSPLKEQEGGASELHKIHEDVGGAPQNEEIVEEHLYEEVVEDHPEDEVIEDTHDDDDDDEGVEEGEEGEGLEDHQRQSVNKTYETEPQPLRDEEKSQLHLQLEEEQEEEEEVEEEEEEEEEEEMNMVSSPKQKDSSVLSPDDIPFAPTQAMTEPLPQEGEGLESEMQEEEGIGWRDSVREDLQTMELPSQLLERITRRAYRSEGGAIMPGVTARGRVTKSLGAGLHPAEREAQSFMGVRSPGELISSALRRSPSVTSQTGAELNLSNAEQENIVSSSVHQSINPLSPPAEKEEHEEEEELEEEEEEHQEEEHQEEEELEEEEEEHQEEEHQEEEELEEEEEEEHQEEELQEEEELEEEEDQEEELEEHREGAEHGEEEGADREEMEVEADKVDDDEDEEDAQSEELSMQTPAFIRQRKQITTPGALTTPPRLKIHNTAVGGVKRGKVKGKRGVGCDVLPKSYVMSVFKHFAKTKVSSDVYPVINDILQKYFERLAEDLEVFSAHARRRTIEVEDVELLMRRQGFVTDSTPLTLLIEKFLPLEYRKLLIPVATSGNKLIPDQRR